MSPGLCLEVILWVPVGIKDDHSVGSGQIHPQPPSPGGQQEAEIIGALSIEVVNSILTTVSTYGAIQSLGTIIRMCM